jgi:Caudovirus prohead serine protease
MAKVRIPRPSIIATLAAESANNDERTIDATFYSGAEVPRFSWLRGEYMLTLENKPGSVRLKALNSGSAPVLEAHSDFSTRDVLGVVEKGWLENGSAKATLRFVKNDSDADQVWNKIEQKVLRNVSMGVRIHKMKETSGSEDKVKSYLATDWEPFEISIVPIGADPGAHLEMAADAGEQEIEVEEFQRATSPKEAQEMPELTAGETAQNLDAVTAAAQTAERTRVLEITRKGALAKLEPAFISQHIEAGTPVDEFIRLGFDRMAARSEINPTREHHELTVTRDEQSTRRAMAESAILNMVLPAKFPVDGQNEFRGMRISRMAEELLTRSGVNVRGKNFTEISHLTMMATADFPFILADSAKKLLLAAYEAAVPTYKTWTKASTASDFKTMSRLRLSETPAFLKVPEGAQITLGTMTESREQYAIATYGRGVSFTRQMLINDDLGAFNDLISAFGIQASRLENQTVYAILTANAAMADGVALFHATHLNLGSGALGNTSLDAMYTAMGTQKGLDGSTILNIKPQYLIVPLAKAVTAQSVLTPVGPSVKISDQNWFAGRLTIVADAELDANSTIVWYGAADPSTTPGIEYAHLQGAEGPQIIRQENQDAILGVQLYAYLDFGAKAIDWRPLYKSTGV